MYISGVFVLVIFDSLLKEFYGIMGQLEENNTAVTQEILNGILGSILGTIGSGLLLSMAEITSGSSFEPNKSREQKLGQV